VFLDSAILSEVTINFKKNVIYKMKILQYLITNMYAVKLRLREFYLYMFAIL